MTDHNSMYRWRSPEWGNPYLNMASNDFKLLSEVYEYGADAFMIDRLNDPDSIHTNKHESRVIPAREEAGNWVFIPDEVFDDLGK